MHDQLQQDKLTEIFSNKYMHTHHLMLIVHINYLPFPPTIPNNY